MNVPWRDWRGRFLPLKATVLVSLVRAGRLWMWLAAGELGGRPVMEAIHATGLWATRFLLISLAITLLARALDWPGLLLVRRNICVAAACYAVRTCALRRRAELHGSYSGGGNHTALHLTIGFVSLLVLLALTITSTDEWVKHLGRNWKRLHRLAYPLGAVALLHFYIQAKLNVSEPVFVSGLFVWLMLWRAGPEAWRRDRRIAFTAALYSGLAAVSGVVTVVMEFGWDGLTNKIDPWRVLYANETIARGLRPGHWVIVATAALMITLIIRRSMGPTRLGRQVAA